MRRWSQYMGMIFDIKRYAIHDGPGIRTTIFLKGCPLNCLWCHNPEGKAAEQEFMWWKTRCIRCGDCQKACAKNAISFSDDSLILDVTECNYCGACLAVCHSQALELIGKEITVSQLMKEVEKDVAFYDESGGGVTFSGGEPLMQPVFLCSLLKACKEKRIHTAVDTCGYVKPRILLDIGEFADLFLYDVKVIDDNKHVEFTGVSNKLILGNVRKLSDIGHRIIVRSPVVPGVNDEETDISELGAFVSSLKNVEELHVLPYHRAGVEKAKRLKKQQEPLFVSHPPSAERLCEIAEKLRDFGLEIQVGG